MEFLQKIEFKSRCTDIDIKNKDICICIMLSYFCWSSLIIHFRCSIMSLMNKTKDWALIQTAAFVLEIKMLMLDLVRQLNFSLQWIYPNLI